MGQKIDKYGHRKMIVIISLSLGAAALWMSFVFNPVMLLIGFFLMKFFGQGSMGLWPQTLVPYWFKSKRGLAMSILGIGSALGPLPFGLAYDYFNGYTEVMFLVMILPILALGASYLAKPPEYNKIK